MIRRIYLYGMICLLLTLNIGYLIKFNGWNKLMEKSGILIKELRNEINIKNQIIEEKDNIEAFELINNDSNIPIDSIVWIEKTQNQPLLVFRFSTMSCHSCIDSMLILIKMLPISVQRNVLIISDNNTKRELKARIHYIGMKRINLAVSDRISFPFDTKRIPYLFVVDDDLALRMMFIPDVRNRLRTIGYLKYVVKKYYNEKF